LQLNANKKAIAENKINTNLNDFIVFSSICVDFAMCKIVSHFLQISFAPNFVGKIICRERFSQLRKMNREGAKNTKGRKRNCCLQRLRSSVNFMLTAN